MVSDFNKNAIINGLVDYFCLVCETYFTTEEVAEQHMEEEIHKKHLEASTYVEMYKSEYIRKVKAGYFCEYCNKLLSTKTKVNLHIEELTHKENKGIALLRYSGDDVMFNDVVIKEEAWHGFCGDTCAICNCEVEDFAEHKADHGHILKLVQGKVQFGPNNSLYRNVDKTTFQCVTCNKIFALSTFEKHFHDLKHQEIYNSLTNIKTKEGHIKSLEKIVKRISVEKYKHSDDTTSTSMKDSLDENTSDTNILDYISDFQINHIRINLDTEKAFCKRCYVDVTFDCEKIKRHIAEHNNNKVSPLSLPATVAHDYKTTHVKPETEAHNNELNEDIKFSRRHSTKRDEAGTSEKSAASFRNISESAMTVEIFAKTNNISYMAGNTQAHCTVCNVKLPATLINMMDHAKRQKHQNGLMRVKTRERLGVHLPKVSFSDFAKEVILSYTDDLYAIVNDVFCLTAESLLLKKEEKRGVRCLYCDATFSFINIHEHVTNHLHHGSMNVVLRDDGEFIREVHSGIFHCGYCNMLVGDWFEFEEHIKQVSHVQTKIKLNHQLMP